MIICKIFNKEKNEKIIVNDTNISLIERVQSEEIEDAR